MHEHSSFEPPWQVSHFFAFRKFLLTNKATILCLVWVVFGLVGWNICTHNVPGAGTLPAEQGKRAVLLPPFPVFCPFSLKTPERSRCGLLPKPAPVMNLRTILERWRAGDTPGRSDWVR